MKQLNMWDLWDFQWGTHCVFAKQWISQYRWGVPNPCSAMLLSHREGSEKAVEESRNHWQKPLKKHYPYRHIVK
ncbi:MAG: hypothetical protein F6J93_38150 [Oscillatoria sp. SIO1A7]|nr:hypothetical protein [Oscillatoria sp. SIO1A7]